MPEEIRLRLLLRAIDRFGHEGPAELGKVEALLVQLDRSFPEKTGKGRSEKGRSKGARIGIRQTLAGALVSLSKGRIRIEPAPVRRGRTGAVSGRTKSRLRDENA